MAHFILFGGQGYPYLTEIQSCLKREPSSLVRQLVELGNIVLCEEEEKLASMQHHLGRYRFSSNWLVSPMEVPQPPLSHLSSSPCSFPLIFLAQMCNYADTLERLGETQETFLPQISAGSGHSQGVVSALVVSLSKTTEELKLNTLLYLRCMFWLGFRVHMSESLQFESPTSTNVTSSPMLAVNGLTPVQLSTEVEKTFNELQTLYEQTVKAGGSRLAKRTAQEDSFEAVSSLHLSLINGRKTCIVSGRPKALQALKDNLNKISAPSDSQFRIPFSNRKPEVTCAFLQASSPFHSEINAKHVGAVCEDWKRILVQEGEQSLAFPVLSTTTGVPLNLAGDFIKELVEMQLVDQLNFPQLAKEVPKLSKLVLEFGPGGGAAKLLLREQEGSGILVIMGRVVNAGGGASSSSALTTVDSFASSRLTSGPNWGEEFAPKLVYSSAYGKHVVDTRFTRLVMKPPVVMAGMTPTTGYHGLELVSACTRAGFHGEMAGGGMPLPEHFKAKIEELIGKNPNGAGINVNMLYLNAHLWGFQFPMFLEMARAGFPVESVTIAAGVPTAGKAEEILEQLASVGTKYLSLKPGSVLAIAECLSIAKTAKRLGISLVIQWTGGRGGGHHSFEDFHEPLLQTYAAIREHSNVVLIVGSGFGDAEHSFPYLSGTWSLQFGKPKMPCDGILMGSRCMVALEANTSPSVKEMLVQTSGVDVELDWERSYLSDAGGVITVMSELGEPIHKIHNRGMKCWREFDRKYFSLERGPKRESAILRDKREIIARLNADFQKVFFGLNMSTRAPCDLEEMTYLDVLLRMVELMYVVNGTSKNYNANRWIDVTYQSRTFSFLVRAERRFRRSGIVVVDDVAKLRENPVRFVIDFGAHYPEAATTLLADDDVSYFVELCRDLRNGKPVNFVPRVDADLDFWFKKDSLWCSEDLDAVPDRDPQRVCVLQGPVAVKFSTKKDEPIGAILDSVHSGWVNLLLQDCETAGIEHIESFATLNFSLEPDGLFPFLSTVSKHSWQRIVLAQDVKVYVQSNKRLSQNVIPKLFKVALDENLVVSVSEDTISCTSVELKRLSETELRLRVWSSAEEFAEVIYKFQPFFATAPLVQVSISTKSVFAQVWLSPSDKTGGFSVHDEHFGEFLLTQSVVTDFNKAILRMDSQDRPLSSPSLDCAIVCGWRSLIKTLFAQEITGDLLRLVHLSHAYKLLNENVFSQRLMNTAGETVSSRVRVVSVQILRGSGKKIVCQGVLKRGGVDWVEITSAFLIRGEFHDFSNQFSRLPVEREITITVRSEADCAVLKSKPWFSSTIPITADTQLVFSIRELFEKNSSEFEFDCVRVVADVYEFGDRVHIVGSVQFESNDILMENPVLAFLQRHRDVGELGKMLGGIL